MRGLLYLLFNTIIVPSSLWAEVGAQAPADTAVYAVSYVDVMPSSRGTAVAALKQYRETSRKDEGYGSVELFEQIGRPGHLAILETWTGQKAFDAHGMAAHTKKLLGQLESARLS